MTTDTNVMTILERANPVPPGELVDVPDGAARYLEHAQEQRSEPMTVIDPTPTRPTDQPPRRRWPLVAVAASVVALVVASIALVVATRDDAAVVDQPEPTVPPTVAEADAETTPEPDEPASTTTAAPDPGAARAVVDEFFAAYNDGDTDAVMALVAAGASVTDQYGASVPAPSAEPIDRVDVENGLAWNHAQGEVWTTPECEVAAEQLPTGATLTCRWETLDAVVQAVDGEPIPTNALIVVADGAVVGLHRAFSRPDFGTLGLPFQTWMETSHPGVEGAGCCSGDTREESEQRGEIRAEWAQAWAGWLESWECPPGTCTITAERWNDEYEALCRNIGPDSLRLPEMVERLRTLPNHELSPSAASTLLAADGELLAPDISDEFLAELQRLRLETMIALGIDERCHPAA